MYKAQHLKTKQDVAIKSISRSRLKNAPKYQENLRQEIEIMRRIAHPNVVRLFDVQRTQRHIYLVLEYCRGGDLHQFIRRKNPHGPLI